MLKLTTALLATSVFLAACAQNNEDTRPAEATAPAPDKYMSNIKQLTTEGDNGEAYFNYDGNKLIFQSSNGGEGCDKIWTMNLDGSGKTMVSADHGAHTCSFIMPGNDKIIYSSTAHLEGACPPKSNIPENLRYAWSFYPFDIYMADADGSNPVNLTADNPKYDAEPIPNPAGDKIVFGSLRDGDFDIHVMDADGSNVIKLTDTIGYDGGPWWSPNGSKIVWRAWHPETEDEKAQWADMVKNDYVSSVPLDIWVMNADGSGKTRLTDNGATNWAPSWHPDGKRILFSSNMDDWNEKYQTYGYNFELYLIDLDGKNLERITHNDVFDSFPMFSPKGDKIIFGANRNPAKPRATDIYIADWKE